MDYDIHSVLSEIEKERFKMIATKTFDLYAVKIHDYFLALKLAFEDKELLVTNTPSLQKDRDEYPRISFSDHYPLEPNWTMIAGKKELKKVSLIRDEVCWSYEGSNWNVTCDIGFIFNFTDQSELIIMMIDSLAGFMTLCTSEDLLEGGKYGLAASWSLKTDVAENATRTTVLLLESRSHT